MKWTQKGLKSEKIQKKDRKGTKLWTKYTNNESEIDQNHIQNRPKRTKKGSKIDQKLNSKQSRNRLRRT